MFSVITFHDKQSIRKLVKVSIIRYHEWNDRIAHHNCGDNLLITQTSQHESQFIIICEMWNDKNANMVNQSKWLILAAEDGKSLLYSRIKYNRTISLRNAYSNIHRRALFPILKDQVQIRLQGCCFSSTYHFWSFSRLYYSIVKFPKLENYTSSNF